MSIWDGVRYGITPVYWLTISGVPVVWIERATGLSLPAEFTIEAEALSIDESAEIGIEHIDRERGVAVSLPLTFKLLDTDTTRDWVRRGSKQMNLTADLAAGGTALTVDDSTGWSNGEGAWLGLERITLGTVASGTSVTGCTRDTAGSLAYVHKSGTTGQIITDRPRFWRGRDVTLWASPCDASGEVTGGNLQADAVIVWRGRLDQDPQRDVDGFVFEALALDRVLDDGLVGSVTGQVIDTAALYAVNSGWTFTVMLRGVNSAGAEVWAYTLTGTPFKALADGTLRSGEQIRTAIATAWDNAVAAESAGADLSGLSWTYWGAPSDFTAGGWQATPQAVQDGTVVMVQHWLLLDGKDVTNAPDPTWPGGMPAGSNPALQIGWTTGDDPRQLVAKFAPTPIVSSVTVNLDEGSPADVPQTGLVRITIGDVTGLLSYSFASAIDGQLYLAGLVPVPGSTVGLLTPKSVVGATVEVVFEDEGTLPDLMLRCLMSSGTGPPPAAGLRSSTYDTLQAGQGYGIDEDLVKESSFTASGAPFNALLCKVNAGGQTFADLFGGALGLLQRAVVCRPDLAASYDAPKLQLVHTAPYGAGWTTTITDADLMADDDDPVGSIVRAETANVVSVLRPLPGGDGEDRIVYASNTAADARGRREVEFNVPAVSREALVDAADAAAPAHLKGNETVQAVELRVGPWVQAEVGDLVYLDLTHPRLWSWNVSPGAPGYTGPARVVGRRLQPDTCRVLLTVLYDSGVTVRALSPAARVQAYDSAAAPTWIDVPFKYLEHFEAALEQAGGNIWVQHYQPGQAEGTSQRHEVSAVAENAGLCRLTIVTNVGGHSLSTTNRSTLTLPTTSGGFLSAWQGNFAHVDDGTSWG